MKALKQGRDPGSEGRHFAAKPRFRAKQVMAAAALLLIGFTFSGCGSREWVEFRGSRGLGLARTSIEAPIAVKWKLILAKQPDDRRHFNQPLLMDRTIYFGSADGNFYSLDLDSGFMNWTFRTGGPINSVAFADGEKVYFGSSDGYIYAVDRRSGEAAWQFQARGQVNSTVVGYEDMIVAAGDADAVYFLSTDGELQFELDNAVWYRNSYQVFDDILAFAPGSPENPYDLAVYDLANQRYLWQLGEELDRYFWFSFPAVKRGRLFFSVTGLVDPGVWEHYFAGIDLYSGEILWERTDLAFLTGEIGLLTARDYLLKNALLLDYGAPLVWRNQVIYAMGDQLLRSYRAGDGEIMWQRSYDSPVSTAPTLAGDRIYFGLEAMDGVGRLVCASPTDGRIFWDIEVEGTILNTPVIAGPWIIFGTDEGLFYVMEELF
jgi:outer membrane protein assembly factor BamB